MKKLFAPMLAILLMMASCVPVVNTEKFMTEENAKTGGTTLIISECIGEIKYLEPDSKEWVLMDEKIYNTSIGPNTGVWTSPLEKGTVCKALILAPQFKTELHPTGLYKTLLLPNIILTIDDNHDLYMHSGAWLTYFDCEESKSKECIRIRLDAAGNYKEFATLQEFVDWNFNNYWGRNQ